MQQYQVPQFIEVEDKIFGPLTVKQFVYVLGGVGIVVILWLMKLPAIIFWLLAVPVGAFFGSFAFLKINEQRFDQVLNNAITHFTHPRLYIWKKEELEARKPKVIIQGSSATPLPKLSQRKLQDLAWSLDINNTFKR